MILYAPADAPVDILYMPDPVLGNERGQALGMSLKTARDGTQYTHVKRTGLKTLTYSFENVGRGKIVEVQEFLKRNNGNYIRVEDHRGDLWRVLAQEEEHTFSMDKKASPVLEAGSFELTFIGEAYV